MVQRLFADVIHDAIWFMNVHEQNHPWFLAMLKFVFVYLANTAVLCYSLTIICCCQVQDYIYWIISTENDHRHHHKFIKYEKRLRKEGKNMFGLPIKQNICKFSASLDA
jgi:hypothetical protein